MLSLSCLVPRQNPRSSNALGGGGGGLEERVREGTQGKLKRE